jgi:putative RNA 2'-phosphotransferase
MPISLEELQQVVARCEKQRFAFDHASTRIRANQGHSTEVDLQLEEAEPPDVLFHGTAEHNLHSILDEGLRKMARHHVHLSPDTATARKVGSRHGKSAILAIDAIRMRGDSHVFLRSVNGVWLVKQVPPEYLRLLPPETR